jgi:RNA polymerase sigma-70 factor (ECF subfamily)
MQQTEKPSFEQVLTANKEAIFRICRIYASTPMEPQDLFQEVTFHIWKAYSTFENRSNVNTWVYRVALNVCIRSKEKLEKRNEKMTRFDSIELSHAPAKTDKLEEEKYLALRSCINKLHEVDQAIVILSLDELPYKEIAAVTGITENHVAVKMKRIRTILLRCITNKINEDDQRRTEF